MQIQPKMAAIYGGAAAAGLGLGAAISATSTERPGAADVAGFGALFAAIGAAPAMLVGTLPGSPLGRSLLPALGPAAVFGGTVAAGLAGAHALDKS